jgi:hypothetical protein
VGTRGRAAAVVATMVTLGLAAPSLAQDRPHLELSGFVGGATIVNDLGSAGNLFFTVTGQADNAKFGKLFGFRGSYRLVSDIAVEGSFYRSENDFTASLQDNKLGLTDLGEQFTIDHTGFSGNIVVDFPLSAFNEKLVPYGTAGVGWIKTEPQNAIVDIADLSSIDVNLGGGAKVFFNRWIGARVDVRYHLVSEGLAFPGSESSPRHTEFSIGGVLRLF